MKSLVRLATAALLLAATVSVHAAPLDGARQLIVVTSDGWDSTQGQLQAYVRDGKGWHTHGQAFPVALGRTGSAWGLGLQYTFNERVGLRAEWERFENVGDSSSGRGDINAYTFSVNYKF